MNSHFSFYFSNNRRGVVFFLGFLIFGSLFLNAQIYNLPRLHEAPRQASAERGNGNNSTMASTCPTSPVTLTAQTLTNFNNGSSTTVANNATVTCNSDTLVIYASGGSATNENTPCIATDFNAYHANMATNGTENFYEGGVNIGCIGPSSGCAFPIGGGTGIPGFPWDLYLGYLDPGQQHDFEFCRSGNITTNTVTLIDCWTGNPITNATPTYSAQYSTSNPPNTSTCFTLTVPANTDIGNAVFSIAPASANPYLMDTHYGIATVAVNQLPVGSYTVTYTFTPSASSGCAAITGTYKFKVGPTPTLTVNSPSVCAGGTTTLTASSTGTGTTYSWSPSSDLSASTGNPVSVTPSSTTATVYTITGTTGGCTSTTTSTVSVTPGLSVAVNSETICPGATTTLTATGASTYTWSPSTGLSATSGNTVTATATATTIYTVTGSTGNCSSAATSTVTINSGISISVTSDTICVGGSANLTASGASTYTWSPATGLSATTGATVIATPTVSQTYTVTGALNGCTGTDTSVVKVNNNPILTVNSPTVCIGDSVKLTVSGGDTTYLWNPLYSSGNMMADTVYVSPMSQTVYTITGKDTTTGCSSQVTGTVSVNPLPTATITSTSIPVQCTNSSTVALTASPATGTFSGTGVIDNGSGTGMFDPSVAGPGTFTVKYTTSNSCGNAIDSISITVNQLPSATAVTGSSSLCAGDTLTLDTSSVSPAGVYTYSWSGPASFTSSAADTSIANVSTANAGTYTLTISNGACSYTSTVGVVINTQADATINNGNAISPLCANSSPITLTAANAGGTWSGTGINASGVFDPTVSGVGTDTITYTIGGTCGSMDTAIITVMDIPVFTVTSGAVCLGQDSVKLYTTQTGSLNATYSWTPAGGLNVTSGDTVMASPSNTTNYTVTGTASNSCTNTAIGTVTVSVPATITITPSNTTICIGNTVTLTATPSTLSYTWASADDPNFTPVSNASVTATPTANATYTVVGVDANMCYGIQTASVNVDTIPVFTVNNGALCAGQSNATLTAVPTVTTVANPSYSWSPATGLNSTTGSSVTASSSSPGALNFTVTAVAGACSYTTTTSVTSYSLPVVSAAPTQAQICVGQTDTLNANGADSYVWSPSSTLNSSTGATVYATPTSSVTTYTVVGTSTTTGCYNTATAAVTTTSATASFSADPTEGDAPLDVSFLNSSSGGTYYWNYGNGSVATTTVSSTHTTYTAAGTYLAYMIVINQAGCKDSTSQTITVNEMASIVIPNVFSPNSDNINDFFYVKTVGYSFLDMQILDRWGVKMFSSSSLTGMWDGKHNGKDVSEGSYFYIIKATDKTGKSTDYKGYVTIVR